MTRPIYLASPLLAVLGWLLSGLGVAVWIWRRAPLIDAAHDTDDKED